MSGMHGDEFGVIELVKDYLLANQSKLPNFLYIPKASPSAVRLGTRVNECGLDLNRSFLDSITDPEVDTLKQLFSLYHFKLCLDFHEDLDRTNEFYLYDSEQLSSGELERLRSSLIKTGAELYSGPDDRSDLTLNHQIDRGYFSLPFAAQNPRAGFFSTWANRQGLVNREVTVEVPGRAPSELKAKLIQTVFQFFLSSV